MAKFLDTNALTHLWAKIKSAFALIDHTHDEHYTKEEVDALINSFEAKISDLETALANKQDKIESWGDLAE